MKKFDITREQAASVVVKNLGNARFNSYAQAFGEITVEDVLASKVLTHPITELEAKPTSDGACALIIGTEEKVRQWTDKPVWIEGMGNCHDAHLLGDRELSEAPALTKAAGTAYKMAGISDPAKELDVVELSEYSSYQELLWSEGLDCAIREAEVSSWNPALQESMDPFRSTLPVVFSQGYPHM